MTLGKHKVCLVTKQNNLVLVRG